MTLTAHDQHPEKATLEDTKRALHQNENGGLDYQVKVKIGARVMLTVNLDVNDRLINGQMGTILKIKFYNTYNAEIIYVNFDDENSGCTLIQKSGDLFAIENNVCSSYSSTLQN